MENYIIVALLFFGLGCILGYYLSMRNARQYVKDELDRQLGPEPVFNEETPVFFAPRRDSTRHRMAGVASRIKMKSSWERSDQEKHFLGAWSSFELAEHSERVSEHLASM